MTQEIKRAEFKINIENTPKEYIDGLILGIVHSGYDVYLSSENKAVCFTGWIDDIMTIIKD